MMRNTKLFLLPVFLVTARLSTGAFLPIARRSSHVSSIHTSTGILRGGSTTTAQGMSVVSFDNGPFLQSQAVLAGANALGLVISLATGSHLHLDLLGTGAFGLAAAVPLPSELQRVQWSSLAVITWSIKLAGFLFWRALKLKHDARLTDTLSTNSGAVFFWVGSWVWGVVCGLPQTLGSTSSAAGNPIALKVGTATYILGLLTETLADYQKWTFKQSNPGEFCNAGLWSLSQHPNFFGNLLIWTGLFIMNCTALVDTGGKNAFTRYWRVGLALLSPLFMGAFFYGQASGAISNTMELFEKKYGDQPGFSEYMENTPLIIPNPFKAFQS